MDFQTSIRTCFSRYADFNGRATRSEYWWFVLFTTMLSFGAGLVDGSGTLGTLVWLVTILPSSAACARRLHDTGRSGWWQLLWLTCVGAIPLLVWLASEGTPGENVHGADPRVTDAGETPWLR
ncbi:MAG: hypothetical protein RL199_1567 [Pseudomonadota bacterium]|jgi:uncharacterized membrane protein YhaH (DUF805 family)